MSSGWPQEDDGLQWPPARQVHASRAARDVADAARGYPPYRPDGAANGGHGSPYHLGNGDAAWRSPAAPVTSWDLPALREPADGTFRYRDAGPRPGGYRENAGGTGYQAERPGGPAQPGYGVSARTGREVTGYRDADRPAAGYRTAGYGDDRGGRYRELDYPGFQNRDPGTRGRAYQGGHGQDPGYGNGYNGRYHPGNGSPRPFRRDGIAGRDAPLGLAASPRDRQGRHGGYAPARESGYEQAGHQDAGYGVNGGYGVSAGNGSHGYQGADGVTANLRLPRGVTSGYPPGQPAAGDYDSGRLSAWDSGQPSAQHLLADELASGEFPTSQFSAGGLGAVESSAAATSVLDRTSRTAPRAPGRHGGRGEATVIQRPPAAPVAGGRGSSGPGWAATTTSWFMAVRDGGRPPGKRRGRSGDHRLWIALGGVVVVAVVAILAIVTFALPSGPGGPAHTLVTPARLGSFIRRPALEQQMNADQLRQNFLTMNSGHASHVVEGVYEAGTSASGKPPQILMFLGGNLAYASPSASLSSFLQQSAGATAISPGSLGGKAACVSDSAAQPGSPGNMAICVWFDNDTVGELVSPTMNAADLAQTMRSVRPQLELVAAKKK